MNRKERKAIEDHAKKALGHGHGRLEKEATAFLRKNGYGPTGVRRGRVS